MGFTVRFMLGTVLVLLCSWSIQATPIHRAVRQVVNNGSRTNDELEEIQGENKTQNIVANLDEDSSKPKTDFSTEDNKTIDKENSIISKLQKSESYKKAAPQLEIARSIDIEKYVSKEFHNKNNVYALPVSPDTEKFMQPDFEHHSTTHGHDFSEHYDYHVELTTPRSPLFDDRYQEAVESVDQKLEHIDDSHEISSESESKESINLEKLYEETKKNGTKADLNYVDYKNIIANDTTEKNSLHKDLVVEAGTNLDFRSSYNHTIIIDEDDSGNNTIPKELDEKKAEVSTLSNIIPAKGDLDHAESSTSKSTILTTRKSIILTKPPSNKNSSHISILSNNIETETVKAINRVLTTTEKSKGETEVVPEIFPNRAPIEISKRPFVSADVPKTESPVDTNHINKKSEQLLQENQVIPVHVEPPMSIKNVSEGQNFETTTKEIVPLTTTTEKSPEATQASTTKKIVPLTTTTEKSPETTQASTTKEIIPLTTTTEKTPEATKASTTEEIVSLTTITEKNPETTKASVIEVLLTTSKATTTASKDEIETTTLPVETTIVPVESTTLDSTTEAETTSPPISEATTISPFKIEAVSEDLKEKETTTIQVETETRTSVVTETSVSPWEIVTQTVVREPKTLLPKFETETTTVSQTGDEITTSVEELLPTTTFDYSYQSDSAAATFMTTESLLTPEESTTVEIPTSEVPVNKNSEEKNFTATTEDTVRTSKGMVFNEETTVVPEQVSTTLVPETTTLPEVVTTEIPLETTYYETKTTTQVKVEPETTTTIFVPFNHSMHVVPDLRNVDLTESPELETTTDNNTITSEFYENTDPPEDNSGTIAAITISSIGGVCLILLAGLLVIMRKRQKRFNYGQRCTPVSLDDYSMDNVSVYNSVRRKGMLRGSKRSYGNPAFEDPVCVSHPLNFPALGKFANNLEDIKAEFEEIPQITARTNELPEGCDTKNRYANVIPLPETRVFLSLIEGYPNSDYINANYVTGPKNTKGYYIACQAPLQNTVDDFWRMIWEQQCKVILMLTHLFENGVEKCVDYLPPSEVLDCHRLFGDYQVTLKKREVKDKYIISSLQLKNMVSNSWREVTHFWYLGWPEKGVPTEANSLIAFLIEARSYMKSASLDRKEVTNGNLTNGMTKNEVNPVVVHCSPGTGRTGVVIACDIAIREFEQTRLVDVPRILYRIRRDRASAVQTKDQYAFIYKVINLYATKLTGGALDSL